MTECPPKCFRALRLLMACRLKTAARHPKRRFSASLPLRKGFSRTPIRFLHPLPNNVFVVALVADPRLRLVHSEFHPRHRAALALRAGLLLAFPSHSPSIHCILARAEFVRQLVNFVTPYGASLAPSGPQNGSRRGETLRSYAADLSGGVFIVCSGSSGCSASAEATDR